MSRIVTGQLDCGAALVVEPIPSVASVALNWLLPIGAATDPPDGDGLAAMLGELVFRGAGGLDSRGHSDALDRLGVQRSSQVLTHHLRLSATLVGDRLHGALPLLADMVTRPALPADAVDAVRSLCLQSLDGLDDEPQQLVMLRLRERHLPPPFHRHGYGDRSVLQGCAIEALRGSWAARCRPGGSILAAAGAVDPDALAGQLNEVLTDWSGTTTTPAEWGAPPRGHTHTAQDSAQMHIGVAYDAPPESDPKSMHERLAVGVLSGGTSARLFTEVRQKRSLCYSVGASYGAGRDYGVVTLYAGTTPQRAQETLDVCLAEIERIREGVTDSEFDRAVIGLKSHLIMQGESTSARAAAIGSDYFRLGRARTLDDVAREIDAITPDAINAYLGSRQFGDLTMASVGPVELAAPARGGQ
ncbi:MAG: M16 family metallopeptidase [Planctomycetota bacterium]|jgi:predicted Zn-dependent peptidase